MGAVLFKGRYTPKLHEMPGRPYQNFTVIIPPEYFLQGRALLTVTRFHLIGVSHIFRCELFRLILFVYSKAGPAAVLEFNNVTINVVTS